MSGPSLSDVPKRAKGQAEPAIGWGSDAIVEQLSRLGLKYIALVPGSSYRGVHDSLVNFKGNTEPQMLVCLHEEHSIAIAHGYAKVTDKPMAAAVHANVGLMHATMAIYNAFCDRVPMLILGATGPVDAAKRRPWIDWIHTSTDQAALIRPFIKYDDQPSSVNAAIHSLLRCTAVTSEKPSAPVYMCMDVSLQEEKIDPSAVHYPEMSRYLTNSLPGPSQRDLDVLAAALREAKKPLFLFGRANRSTTSWQDRVALVELCQSQVPTDLKQACVFPTDHKQHACPPGVFNSPRASEVLREADLVVSFDWVDLAGTLQAAFGTKNPTCKIIHSSLDSALHNGWSKDHFGLPATDVSLRVDPDLLVQGLLQHLQSEKWQPSIQWPETQKTAPAATNGASHSESQDIHMSDLANALYSTTPASSISLIRIPLSWSGADIHTTNPHSFLGQDGGAGIASGPGQAVGAALALHSINSPLLPIAILGDGDYLMGCSALWTAARYRLPLLVIVANNASFFNDEVHQERVARAREREVENKWIGMRLDDPAPDLGAIARGLGCVTVSGDGAQVRNLEDLGDVLGKAVEAVKGGQCVVVDVRVLPDGYSSALEKAK